MADMIDDDNDETGHEVTAPGVATAAPEEEPAEKVRKLVEQKVKLIKADKKYHEKAFKKMRTSMFVAMHGREEDWNEKSYKANISGRHVKQKTAALYAKNPKATARRAERMDFVVWDEDPQSLMIAMQTIQAGVAMMQAHSAAATMPPDPTAPPVDPTAPPGMSGAPPADPMAPPGMGHNGPPAGPLPELPPGFAQAQAIMEDFTQGVARRKMIDKVGRTLEILFASSQREQKPVDFKTAAKQCVRRTATTGVGYVELNFQREYGPRPGMTEQLADAKARLDHLRTLSEKVQEGEIDDSDAEMAELEASVASLQNEPEMLIREGLVFDWPRSTKVIPDKLTKTLVGFIGSRHITLEYDYTKDEVQDIFGVDLKKYTGYNVKGESSTKGDDNFVPDDDDDGKQGDTAATSKGLVRVWKHYDKPSGLVYYIADGHCEFLREPAAPEVFVEDFWPLYALTFNEVESEDELFPPSDVELILDQQKEINRSRQGKREHREAARPRWAYGKGAISDEEDIKRITACKPFEAVGLDIDPATELAKVLQAFPVPGVDPNLYDTNEVMQDMELTIGASEAQFGGTSKSTATESAIAEGSTTSANGSSIDDLDAWLTTVTRSAGVIMLREYSEEQVKKIVGPGAVWPHLTLDEIASEIYLEIEAGSSGRPNQAVEMNNWQKMLPFLVQMPGIKPEWLAKETLKRLDDKMDLTDALVAGLPAIVAQNANAQPGAEDPGKTPDQQGGKGADNTSKPTEKTGGSDAAFGSNQV